ncbi:hypothetical protein [Plantactinospora endophytica]|uniref:Uncharacterized protein n=1 Tax=Plantactinospora endophytica TaxID=673535 RepID=A0ABQ4DW14_9ACTN|nr:hypothetical protein [Plantactinospora endophytica]GIG86636.1 hypothetical protein Pen02_15720 [Plantactinospora endophytica]
MNIGAVKRTIREGNHAARQTKQVLERVAGEAAAAERLARLTVHDSANDDAKAGLAILAGLDREVELTIRRVDAAVEHADTYLHALG